MERIREINPEEAACAEHGICWAQIWAMILRYLSRLKLIDIDLRIADPKWLAIMMGWSTKEGIFREAWKMVGEKLGFKIEVLDLKDLDELVSLQEQALEPGAVVVTEIWDLRDYGPIIEEVSARRIVKDLWEPKHPSSINRDGKETNDDEAYEHSLMIIGTETKEAGERIIWVYDPGFEEVLPFSESEFMAMWFTRIDETKPIDERTGENIVRGRVWVIHPPTTTDPEVFDLHVIPRILPEVADYLYELGDDDLVATIYDSAKLLYFTNW